MKNIKIILAAMVLFAILFVSACETPRKGPFISSYIEPKELFSKNGIYTSASVNEYKIGVSCTPYVYSTGIIQAFYRRNNRNLYFKGDVYSTFAFDTYPIPEIGKNEEKSIKQRRERLYDSLCVVNKDKDYKTTSSKGHFRVGSVAVSPVTNISVVCDKEYDSQHPVGSSLNNYFDIVYYAYKDFIESGYKGERQTNQSLALFNTTQHPLFNVSGFSLIFTELPQTAGEYSFTVTYKDLAGAVISTTTEAMQLPAR